MLPNDWAQFKWHLSYLTFLMWIIGLFPPPYRIRPLRRNMLPFVVHFICDLIIITKLIFFCY